MKLSPLHTLSAIAMLTITGQTMAATTFNSAAGEITDASNWDNDLPGINDSVGTLALDSVFNAGSGNFNVNSWGDFTLNHTGGTLTATANHNINTTASNANIIQDGGNVIAGGAVFANGLTYTLKSGNITALRIQTNNGTFVQEGGIINAQNYVSKTDMIDLTGGSAILSTTGDIFSLTVGNNTPSTVSVGGDYSLTANAATSLLASEGGNDFLVFDSGWTGSFESSSLSWQTQLVNGDVLVGSTTVDNSNFNSLFAVNGNVLTLVPEPTSGLLALSSSFLLFLRRRKTA